MTLIHHVSIINRNVEETYDFYKNILGLDLLMKTVNQDDLTMYHLFFGNPMGLGSEITFFEMKDGPERQFGTNQIERTLFKVQSLEALHYFEQRFNTHHIIHYGIEEYNGRNILRFEGPSNTMLGLAVMHESESISQFTTPENDSIPEAFKIIALDSVHIRTTFSSATIKELKRYYNVTELTSLRYFDSPFNVTILANQADIKHELHIIEDRENDYATEGNGTIHHVALSIESSYALKQLAAALKSRSFVISPLKDRGFFESIYYREPNNILIEVATKAKEVYDYTNQKTLDEYPLILPEYLENKRQQIITKL